MCSAGMGYTMSHDTTHGSKSPKVGGRGSADARLRSRRRLRATARSSTETFPAGNIRGLSFWGDSLTWGKLKGK